jgi:hypothetical protein
VHKTAQKIGRSWPLVVACMLHATAFAIVRDRRSALVNAPSTNVDPLEATRFEVEVDEEKISPSSPSSASTPDAVAIQTSHGRSVARASESEPVIGSMTPPTDSSMPLVRPLPGSENDDGSWTFRSTRGDVDLKLGDKTASLGRDMAAHGELDLPPVKSAAGMTEGLDAIDVARGFGRAGGVVQAIEDVVRDPAAPPEGVAFFDVAIEKNGKLSVSVSETTANREDWERLTKAIAAAVKTKDVRFPDQGKGLRVGVRVEAKVRYPDGRDPKKSGTYGEHTGLKAHTDKNGLVIDELPSVGVGVRGKVCSAQVSIGLLGPSIAGGCSPENIGTHPERTVAAHETYEQRM